MSAAAGAPPAPTISMAHLVRDLATRSPDGVAVRSKRLGIWREVTWAQYWHDIQRAAHALIQLGVAAGDRVAIVSDNRYEWPLVDAATVAVRGATVGVDPMAEPEQLHAALANTRPALVVAESSEQVDDVLAVADRLPDLKHVLSLDGRGVRDHDARLVSWKDAVQHGATADNDALQRRMDAAEPADVVTVLPTAKPPQVTARDTARAVEAVMAGISPPPSDADLVMPITSLADPTTRAFSVWLNGAAGVQLHFSEGVATVRQDLREIQPTLLYAPSQVWERLAADIEQRLSGASRLKRWAWNVWRPARGSDGTAQTPPADTPSAVGHLVVYRALRDRVGLRCVRHAAYSGTVRPETLAFFAGIGAPLSRAEAPWNG